MFLLQPPYPFVSTGVADIRKKCFLKTIWIYLVVADMLIILKDSDLYDNDLDSDVRPLSDYIKTRSCNHIDQRTIFGLTVPYTFLD